MEAGLDDSAKLRGSVEVCMFDLYGTVVDMQTGLTQAATPFLKSKGWPGNPSSFVTWWRRTHFENSMIDALLHREHTPYRRDRPPVAGSCSRSRRHFLHDGRGPRSRGADRKTAAVSGSAGSAHTHAYPLQARRTLERRSRHA